MSGLFDRRKQPCPNEDFTGGWKSISVREVGQRPKTKRGPKSKTSSSKASAVSTAPVQVDYDQTFVREENCIPPVVDLDHAFVWEENVATPVPVDLNQASVSEDDVHVPGDSNQAFVWEENVATPVAVDLNQASVSEDDVHVPVDSNQAFVVEESASPSPSDASVVNPVPPLCRGRFCSTCLFSVIAR